MSWKQIKTSKLFRPTAHSIEEHALQVLKTRLVFTSVVITLMFLVLIVRLVELSISSAEEIRVSSSAPGDGFLMQRASVVDRNGKIIATNLSTASLYASTGQILDPEETVKKLCAVIDSVKCTEIRDKIYSNKSFVWIKRHLSPAEQQRVNDAGIVGVSFIKDEKRMYPHGPLFAHAVGYVDIDGNGLAGIEQSFDQRLKNSNEDLKLSLDIRVQQILRDELIKQASEHSAIGGSGLVMDVQTGEVIAMVSIPDFDPHYASKAPDGARFNQTTMGVYEMGSTFKVLTLAMGLDGKMIGINDAFDTDAVIKIGKKQIKNYRGKGGVMSTPEVLMYSSNIGSAQIGMKVGTQKQQYYLKQLGMLEAINIELPEKAKPLHPAQKSWTQASTITISYGHGIAVTPLHVARAISSVVNGGYMINPTILKSEEQVLSEKNRILSERTSIIMRKLLRLVVEHGYGKKAEADGYFTGGKTGTAEKLTSGGYSKKANLASFVGAFPINDPKYAIVILIDEALPNSINHGFTTGGMLAAPVAGRVIEQIAPMLGLDPKQADDPNIIDALNLDYKPRNPASLKRKE